MSDCCHIAISRKKTTTKNKESCNGRFQKAFWSLYCSVYIYCCTRITTRADKLFCNEWKTRCHISQSATPPTVSIMINLSFQVDFLSLRISTLPRRGQMARPAIQKSQVPSCRLYLSVVFALRLFSDALCSMHTFRRQHRWNNKPINIGLSLSRWVTDTLTSIHAGTEWMRKIKFRRETETTVTQGSAECCVSTWTQTFSLSVIINLESRARAMERRRGRRKPFD